MSASVLGCHRFLFRSFVMLCAALLPSVALAQTPSPKKPAPAEAKVKIRAITAFVNLDRTQYQIQIADAVKMLKRARTIFESRGFQVETIRIATQPFPEYIQGLSNEQAL